MKRQRETHTAICPLLPPEVWQEIFAYIPIEKLFQCNRICRSFDKDLLYKSVKSIRHPWTFSHLSTNLSFERFVNVEYIGDSDGYFSEERLSSYPHLKSLALCNTYKQDVIQFDRLTRLQKLYFGGCHNEGQEVPSSVSCLVNLTRLDAVFNEGLSDNILKSLTNLTNLSVSVYSGMTASGFSSLKALRCLFLDASESTLNDIEYQLPESLESISLCYTRVGNSLSNLTNLTTLKVCRGSFGSASLRKMTNLTALVLDEPEDYDMNDESLLGLTRLTKLNVNIPVSITNESLSKMTNLRRLKLWISHKNTSITSPCFSSLVNLRSLLIEGGFDINDKHLSCLINLTKFRLYNRHSDSYESFVAPVQGTRKKIEDHSLI